MTAADLPSPDADARALSDALHERIAEAIESAGGWLRFDRYMRLALYEPGLGYYSAGAAKLGPAGDFTTAAELGNLLPDALAELFAPLLGRLEAPALIELGAGSGRLSRRLIERLLELGVADLAYSVLEPSADLRARQVERLAPYADRVRWLDRWPAGPFEAIVFGNEVADALPVVRFEVRGGEVVPLGVVLGAGRTFEWRAGEPDDEVTRAVRAIERDLGAPLPERYRSELCLELGPWIGALAAALARGGILLIDYGMPRRDYYRPERSDGTLVCHYRHRVHADPFFLPGLQDITAWVDFSACAATAAAAGLDVAGFTTQAQFLIATLAARDSTVPPDPAESSAIKSLVLPGEMGERFKLLWLTRSLPGTGIAGRDFRNWL